jgi:SAM-dependent methyltransferase
MGEVNLTSQYGGYDDRQYVAEYYDAAYGHIRPQDIVLYTEYSKNCGGRTLELACGTGRILIPTAIAGCEITGLDLSPFMLQKCREKLALQPEAVQKRVKLIQANMTDFKIGEQFPLITMPFRPFQHLVTVAEQKACLRCIHKHLKANGKLVFDVFNPNPVRLMPNPKYMEEVEDLPETPTTGGRKVRRASRMAGYHREQQYNDIELIYYVAHPDGRQERLVQSFPMRYYYRYELEHLLELCGFKVVDLFGNFDKSVFINDSPEMIFVAEKK